MEVKKNNFWNKNKLILKLGFISFLILILMIPSSMIDLLIRERQQLSFETKREIADSWGPHQIISTPILMIPVKKTTLIDGEKIIVDSKMFVTPTTVDMDVDLPTQIRNKSIYEVLLYDANIKMKGRFDLKTLPIKEGEIYLYDQAKLYLALTDPSVISRDIIANMGGESIHFISGGDTNLGKQNSIHADIDISDNVAIKFNIDISLLGHEQIAFNPSAKSTKVNITSDWNSPSFIGSPFPKTREITDDGFKASYHYTEYKRTVPDYWYGYKYKPYQIQFENEYSGVKLIQPIDHYQKNRRTSKYAILILVLTFMLFFLFEVFKGNRTHPIQYIFIGFTLVLFYALLLSFTEHIGFSKAYIISALATVTLISLYGFTVLKSVKSSLSLGIMLSILYTYIFVLLRLDNFALLAGCIGLFLILAFIMFVTRKIDWYHIGKSE